MVEEVQKPVLIKFGYKDPLSVYHGGFFGFKKNKRSYNFFKKWNYYWKYGVKGKDMPSLACALQFEINNNNLLVKEINKKDRIFDNTKGWEKDKNCDEFIIQHRWRGDGFFEKFKIPKYKRNVIK